MICNAKRVFIGWIAAFCLVAVGCETTVEEKPVVTTPPDTVHDTTYLPAPVTTGEGLLDPGSTAITLPVLDAFFADSMFAQRLRDSLQLTDSQIDSLRSTARSETSRLRESTGDDYSGSTMAARMLASERIMGIIGPEKTSKLASIVRNAWGGAPTDSTGKSAKPNSIPTDTRIVVNAPAYRMDLFENGMLVKSWPVSIGYPEFPLPTGLRSARQIIFNPTWTPPDEPWVEGSSKVEVGKTVPAGSKLNPLGILKIPIGMPSLIHGGKQQSQLGRFGSHGCVGLTDEQVREFVPLLAKAAGTPLTQQDIATYGKNRKETKQVDLTTPIPVELRYETIVVQDGELHIHRDVYDRNSNTGENVVAALATHGVPIEQLSADERAKIDEALQRMSGVSGASGDSAKTGGTDSARPKDAKPSGKVTKSIKGEKVVVVPVAALKGKGYPKPAKTVTGGLPVKTDTAAKKIRGA